MNIYYFIEPIGGVPFYDFVRSKQLYMWEHNFMEWRQGVSPPRPKKNSITFMGGALNIGPFKYNIFLETLSLAYNTKHREKGYFLVVLYMDKSWHNEWRPEWGRKPSDPTMENICYFGLCHDTRYPLWLYDNPFLPKDMMDLFPKTIMANPVATQQGDKYETRKTR